MGSCLAAIFFNAKIQDISRCISETGNGQSPTRTPVRTDIRPNGHPPARAIARINYGLLPPGRTQNRTIARTDTRCLRFAM